MDRTISGIFWLLLHLLIVLVPVFLMLLPPVPSGRPFLLEFGVALGFVGLTQIGLQFILTARFRRVTVRAGTRAYLDGPHGAFSSDRYAAAGHVFLAGAIGITPFVSMLRTMADRADVRPVTLIYADKGWDDVAFRDDLAKLEAALNLDVVYVLEEPPDDWDGEERLITDELRERHLPADALDRYYTICGPPVMMKVVESAVLARGVSRARIQLERFAPV